MLSANEKDNSYKSKVTNYTLNLVADNKSRYTIRQVKLAETTKDLYRRIGVPGYKRYVKAVTNGAIMNCTVDMEDIKRAVDIWGKDIIGLKGIDVRRKTEPMGWMNDIPLPPEVLERH